MTNPTTPPGWYDDGHGRQRWWDGYQWTETVKNTSGRGRGGGAPVWLTVILPVIALVLGGFVGSLFGAAVAGAGVNSDTAQLRADLADANDRILELEAELEAAGATVDEPVAEEEPAPAPVEEEPAAPARGEVTFALEGDGATGPQWMEGTYEIRWETGADCSYYADLEPDDSFLDVFTASAATSGSTWVYDLQPREYRIEMITGPAPSCPWTATFVPHG